jgi:hypothetical protein
MKDNYNCHDDKWDSNKDIVSRLAMWEVYCINSAYLKQASG